MMTAFTSLFVYYALCYEKNCKCIMRGSLVGFAEQNGRNEVW